MTALAAWLLFETPTIHGDHGAPLVVLLFLLTGFLGAGLMALAYILTGSTDVGDSGTRGEIK